MDTHPIQASSQRWMVALGLLLLVVCVQSLFLWAYTKDGIVASLLDGGVTTLLFALSAYWAWYALGFVHTSITTLSISVLGISCTLAGSFFTRWVLECMSRISLTPFIHTLPFRFCYVALLWSIALLWYRLQILADEREEMENRLATMQETLVEERRKAETGQRKEEETIPDTDGCLDRITVKDGTRIHLIELADLLYIQSCGDYVTLITPKGEYIKEQTMKYFETHLPESDFVRVHRSSIVQVKQISRLELFGKESYQLILKNGQKLKVSNSGYRLLKERLNL